MVIMSGVIIAHEGGKSVGGGKTVVAITKKGGTSVVGKNSSSIGISISIGNSNANLGGTSHTCVCNNGCIDIPKVDGKAISTLFSP